MVGKKTRIILIVVFFIVYFIVLLLFVKPCFLPVPYYPAVELDRNLFPEFWSVHQDIVKYHYYYTGILVFINIVMLFKIKKIGRFLFFIPFVIVQVSLGTCCVLSGIKHLFFINTWITRPELVFTWTYFNLSTEYSRGLFVSCVINIMIFVVIYYRERTELENG